MNNKQYTNEEKNRNAQLLRLAILQANDDTTIKDPTETYDLLKKGTKFYAPISALARLQAMYHEDFFIEHFENIENLGSINKIVYVENTAITERQRNKMTCLLEEFTEANKVHGFDLKSINFFIDEAKHVLLMKIVYSRTLVNVIDSKTEIYVIDSKGSMSNLYQDISSINDQIKYVDNLKELNLNSLFKKL